MFYASLRKQRVIFCFFTKIFLLQPMSPESKRSFSRPVHIPLYKGLTRVQEGMASSLGTAGYMKRRASTKQVLIMEFVMFSILRFVVHRYGHLQLMK